MSTPSRPSRKRPDPPAKPRPDFPLFAHRDGSWKAKIDGRQEPFGGWAKDPKGERALAEYEAFMENRRAGVLLPRGPSASLTVREVGRLYVDRQRLRAEEGEVSVRTFGDAKAAIGRFTEEVGAGVLVSRLMPSDFAAYRAALKRGMKAHALNRNMAAVKAMFKWARESMLIPAEPGYGPDFKRGIPERRKPKLFTPAEIRGMIEHADAAMKAMVYLGINCGYGDTDCAALMFDEIDLDAGVIDTTRHKSRRKKQIPRRCLLWPETVQAIRDYLPLRPAPADKADEQLVFLTRFGHRWVIERIEKDAKGVPKVVNFSSVQLRFRKCLVDANIRSEKKGDGRSFYTLRRTFRTWADEALDKHAADLVMGHNFGSMGGHYVQGISDERLKAISDLVRGKLLESARPKVRNKRGRKKDDATDPAA